MSTDKRKSEKGKVDAVLWLNDLTVYISHHAALDGILRGPSSREMYLLSEQFHAEP